MRPRAARQSNHTFLPLMCTDYRPPTMLQPSAATTVLIPGFWLAISTSSFPPASRNRRAIQKRKTFVFSALVWSRISLGFRPPQTVFSFHPFVERCFCTAVRQQRNHKDMHKLSDKKEGKKNFTYEAIHNRRIFLFQASVIRKLFLSQRVGEDWTGANSELNFWWQMTGRGSGASEGLRTRVSGLVNDITVVGLFFITWSLFIC